MMSWLKLLLKSIGFAWENRKTIRKVVVSVQDVVDPEPNHGSTPKTYADVKRTQEQIAQATSHGVVGGKQVTNTPGGERCAPAPACRFCSTWPCTCPNDQCPSCTLGVKGTRCIVCLRKIK